MEPRHISIAAPRDAGGNKMRVVRTDRPRLLLAAVVAWVVLEGGLAATNAPYMVSLACRGLMLALAVHLALRCVSPSPQVQQATDSPALPAPDLGPVFDGHPAATLWVDAAAGRILKANQAAVALLGSGVDLDNVALNRIWPTYADDLMPQGAIQREPVEKVAVLYTLDGHTRNVQMHSLPLAGDEAGTSVVALERVPLSAAEFIAGRGVTAHPVCQLEEAHRIARIGTWELDPATGMVMFSDQTYHLLGQRPPAAF